MTPHTHPELQNWCLTTGCSLVSYPGVGKRIICKEREKTQSDKEKGVNLSIQRYREKWKRRKENSNRD